MQMVEEQDGGGGSGVGTGKRLGMKVRS